MSIEKSSESCSRQREGNINFNFNDNFNMGIIETHKAHKFVFLVQGT